MTYENYIEIETFISQGLYTSVTNAEQVAHSNLCQISGTIMNNLVIKNYTAYTHVY